MAPRKKPPAKTAVETAAVNAKAAEAKAEKETKEAIEAKAKAEKETNEATEAKAAADKAKAELADAEKALKKETTKPKVKKFVAVKIALWHPFAMVHIPMGPPGVILEEPDSWLDSQIKRGLVKEM